MKLLLIALLTTASIQSFSQTQLNSSGLTTVVVNDEKENLLADSFSRTLYVFDLDQGSGTSKCIADCAEVWPPYILSAIEAADLKAPLGSIVRTNKKIQLTYNGSPVYTYVLDRVKGDDHGDGIGDVWHYVEVVGTSSFGFKIQSCGGTIDGNHDCPRHPQESNGSIDGSGANNGPFKPQPQPLNGGG